MGYFNTEKLSNKLKVKYADKGWSGNYVISNLSSINDLAPITKHIFINNSKFKL